MASGAQKDRAGWTGEAGRGETWPEFDCLPTGVKRVFWEAPYDYTAAGAFQAYRKGDDLRTAAVRIRAAQGRDVRREAARLYGPEHPQAAQ